MSVCIGCVPHCCISAASEALILSIFHLHQFVLLCAILLHLCSLQSLNFINMTLNVSLYCCSPHYCCLKSLTFFKYKFSYTWDNIGLPVLWYGGGQRRQGSSLPENTQIGSGAHPASYSMSTGGFSLAYDIHLSPPPSTKVTNEGNCLLPYILSGMPRGYSILLAWQ